MLTDDIRGAAFRSLLRSRRPVTAGRLAEDLNRPIDEVRAGTDELRERGELRIDGRGDITGSAGLSVEPDRHQIELDGHRFWTWCAYDILGIFAALRATGRARSTNPDGDTFELAFHDGQPESSALAVFLPAEGCCGNAYEQWCPSSNLFRTADAARAWAAAHGVSGDVLTLPEAAARGGATWRAAADTG